MVRSIVVSVVELWGLGLAAEVCVAFLEDRLREISAKSKFLLKFIQHYPQASTTKRKAVQLQEVVDALGGSLTPGDLVLLLSLACARRPAILNSVAPADLLSLPIHSLRSDIGARK